MGDSSTGRAAARLLRQTLTLAGALVAYHFILVWLMRHTRLVLGVVTPGTKVYRPVPLYCYFRPSLEIGLAVAAVVFLGFSRWFSRVAWDTRRARRGFALAAMGWFVLLACTVAMIDGGPKRIWRPYEKLRETDYIGGVDRVESVRGFLTHYTELQPTLPMHSRTHPPGAILFLWAIHRYVWPGAAVAALATILVASLAVPAVHGLAREVAGRRTARLATALFLMAPNVLLFTATSMEAVFMVPMVWAFYLLFRARRRRPVLFGLAGGLTASGAALFTFSAAWLAIWAIVLFFLTALVDRRRLGRTFVALASALTASLLFYGLLYLWSGYSLPDVLRVAVGQHAEIMKGVNQGTPRQYFHLTLANPIAFFAGTGLVLAVLWARRTWADVRPRSAGALLNLSFLAAFVIVVLLPLYTLEVERIWIFLVPLVAIAAARELRRAAGREQPGVGCLGHSEAVAQRAADTSPALVPQRPGAAIRTAFVLLAAQTILMETLLETSW